MKDDLAYLLHIRDAIVRVLQYTRDGEHAVNRYFRVVWQVVARDLPTLQARIDQLLTIPPNP